MSAASVRETGKKSTKTGGKQGEAMDLEENSDVGEVEVDNPILAMMQKIEAQRQKERKETLER